MTNARLEELRTKFLENPRRYFAPYANELRKAGDPAQAISVCRAHLAGQPGHVSGHIVLGQALYEAGETGEARDIFTAALELDPENLIALRTLGEIAQVDGDFSMARQWYERLLDADPRNNDVAQLLRDIPAEPAAPTPPAPSASAVAEVDSEPTPFSVRVEEHAEPEPEPTPAPTFHTSFTGSGPAYRDEEPAEEPAIEGTPAAAEETAAEMEHVEAEMPVELPAAMASADAGDTLDLVDLDVVTPLAAEPEPLVEASLPDEAHAGFPLPESVDLAEGSEWGADSHATEVEPAAMAEADVVNDAAAEWHHDTSAESSPPEIDEEPTRAVFAEHGFDGPADDTYDWMTTPSAALSDLESAPEDWYDESPTESSATTEYPAGETAPAEMRGEDPATDSWFDDVEGASAIETTEVSSDEFWLPPELPQVASADAAAALPAAEAPEEALASQVSDFADPDSFVSTAAEPQVVEPEPVSVEMASHETEEPILVEHPGGTASPEWSEPIAQQADAVPIEGTAGAEDVVEESAYASMESSVVTPPEIDAVIGRTPAFIEAVQPPPAPFVTETLAELYLQQGFRDEALGIYRQLAERDPSDQAIRDRITAIEQGGVLESTPAAAAIPTESHTSSQSVRTFFSRLARRPAMAASSGTVTPRETQGPAADVPFAAAASALANLFAASKPHEKDEGAASTLAGAFTDPAGRPSRAADGELSLDHLFRDVPPGGSPSGGVSLDEFYSTPSESPGSPTEPGEATESAESGGADIRQFTAWLEGLRKK